MLGLALSLWIKPASQATPAPFIPSLDFTDARNSGYAALIGL